MKTTIELPEAIAAKLHELCDTANIEGGADALVSAVMGDMIEDGTIPDVLLDGWDITDPALVETVQSLIRESGLASA